MPVESTLHLGFVRACVVVLLLLVGGYALTLRDGAVAAAFVRVVLVLTAWGTLTLLPKIPGVPLVGTNGVRVGLELAKFAGAGGFVVLWFVYVRRYTGHRQYTTRRRIGVMLAPVAVAVAITGVLAAAPDSLSGEAAALLAVILFPVYVYLAALFVLGVYLLFRLAWRYRQVPYTQVAVLGSAIVAPYVAVIATELSRPAEDGATVSILPVDVSVFGFLVAGLGFAYAIRAYDLFTTVPESEYVARDEVLENLSEGVLILDADDRILDMNAAAVSLCRASASDALGRPVRSVFDGLPQIPTDGVRRTELQTPDGPRQFDISLSRLTDGDGGLLGQTLLFRDVTATETREQQLTVLTRVLRHNLRNDLDTALAHTNEIADPAVRETVRAKLKNLSELGDKAREIEDVLSKAHEPRTEVDVAALVRSVAARLGEDHDDCRVEVTAPEELTVVTHRDLLDRLVTELVENGIEHNDESPAEVAVTVRRTERHDGAVEIEIVDDGPGIPAHERTVIESESETPFEHGAGVGLWLANWIAESLGGDLSFGEGRSGGTEVTVTLWARSLFPSDSEPSS
jgi:signal transduction histidine kinase